MKTMDLWIRIFLVVSASPLFPCASWAAGLSVQIQPAQVERRTFDPKNPPAEMPKLTPPEAALCAFGLKCNVEARVTAKQTAFNSSPPVISDLNLVTTLQITIWLPTNSTPKLNAHEEAHRQIYDHYYATAEAVARDLGKKTIGLRLHSPFKQEKAWRNELNGIQQELIDAFMHRMTRRCSLAQELFDAATEHGTNGVPEDRAVERAIAAASPSSADTGNPAEARSASRD